MKLMHKIALAGGALGTVVLASGALTVFSGQHSVTLLNTYQQQDVRLQGLVQAMQRDFYNYDDQNNMYVLVAAAEPDQVQLWHDTYDQAVQAGQALHGDITTAKGLGVGGDVQSLLARVESDVNSYDNYFHTGHDLVQAGNTGRAAHEETIDNLAPSNDIMPVLQKLGAEADQLAADSLNSVDAAQNRVMFAGIASAVGMLAACLVVALMLASVSRRILNPLPGMIAKMREIIASRDLTKRIGWQRRDEMGELSDTFDEFVGTIQEIVREVTENAELVAGASQKLSATSGQISGNAASTGEQTELMTAAAEHVSDNVRVVATGAEEMTASINEIAHNAAEAARIATDAVSAAEATNITVRALGASSAEVGDVVRVITSIAEQTNLLALNATIEAARAGDAGKGFAVVASEVKDLAQETAKATQDIATRIEAIQADTGKVVGAIGEIGTVIVKINDYQATIASAVQEQTATTAEMSRNVAEAAGGSGQLTDRIRAVADATADTSQGVDEVEANATDLARMSEKLQRLVGQFVV